MFEGVCVDGAMILVSGSSGFRSRWTIRNQQPIRDRPKSKRNSGGTGRGDDDEIVGTLVALLKALRAARTSQRRRKKQRRPVKANISTK